MRRGDCCGAANICLKNRTRRKRSGCWASTTSTRKRCSPTPARPPTLAPTTSCRLWTTPSTTTVSPTWPCLTSRACTPRRTPPWSGRCGDISWWLHWWATACLRWAAQSAAVFGLLVWFQSLIRFQFVFLYISRSQPFWPMGTGCARGFLAAYDTAWMVKGWAQGRKPLEILAERYFIPSINETLPLCFLMRRYTPLSVRCPEPLKSPLQGEYLPAAASDHPRQHQ